MNRLLKLYDNKKKGEGIKWSWQSLDSSISVKSPLGGDDWT